MIPVNKNPKYLIASLVIGAIFSFYFMNKIERRHAQYTKIEKHSEVKGYVESFFVARGNVYIKIGSQKVLILHTYNNALSPHMFCDFISTGDKLVKKKGDIHFYICRSGTSYKFKLDTFDYFQKPINNGCN